MDRNTLPEAGQACAADLQLLASQGVQRALAARMTALSARQIDAVSGGAYHLYDDYCGNGIIPLPKGGGGVLGGGVVVIINGRFPEPYQFESPAGVVQGF